MGKKLMEEKASICGNYGVDKLKKVLELLVNVYLLGAIAVLPMYNKLDYAHIGTDKVTFFMKAAQYYATILLPVLAIYLVAKVIWEYRENHTGPLKLLKRGISNLSLLDGFVLLYLAAVLVSTYFSEFRELAVQGSNGWRLGMYTQVVFCGSYFLISRLWDGKKWILRVFFPVTVVIFGLGYLNRFNIYPIKMGTAGNPQFITLIGNINWYCGYMVMPIFGYVAYALCRLTEMKCAEKIIASAYLLICFLALTTNGSSSGFLVLFAVMFLLFLLALKDNRLLMSYLKILLIFTLSISMTGIIRHRFPGVFTYEEASVELMTASALPYVLLILVICLCAGTKWLLSRHKVPEWVSQKLPGILMLLAGCGLAGLAVLIAANTLRPGCIGPLSRYSVFTFSKEWGSRRGVTWMAGIQAWKEQGLFGWLFGVGPDCMGRYIRYSGSEKLQNLVFSVWPEEQNVFLTNAHNELLTNLVQTGLLGAVGFAGASITAIIQFGSGIREYLQNKNVDDLVIGACGVCVLAYTVHNLFSFQQVLNGTTFFVILGIGEAYRRRKVRSTAV